MAAYDLHDSHYHRRLSIGVEALSGPQESNDGSDDDSARVTAGLVDTIFD